MPGLEDILKIHANKELNRNSSALHNILRYQKRSRQEQFKEITINNNLIVTDLVKVVRRLTKEGKVEEADKLLDIAYKILRNNEKLQNLVGEVLSDAK